ncbi:AraC family transcriptional regulator [Pedobacter sp. Leaf250]|uniref:helix-turn-helix transcriptional regulator n=1 Tax=Pedobacter sp. Leaf250 TaxID=2876559 RepID=UPI001E3ADF83|nr:AraC family transcriptional regulator [Pedobacter sp. Leaf250]
MTQSEEIVTLKGESQQIVESVFLYNKNMETSYRTSIEDRTKIEIRLNHPDATAEVTFQMIFVLKGKVQVSRFGSKDVFFEINSHQHNFCRLPFKTTRMLVNTTDDMLCINISSAFLKRFLPSEHAAYQQLFSNDLINNPVALSEINMQITPEISAILQKLSHSTESAFSDRLLLESKAIELFALQVAEFEQLKDNEAPIKLKKIEMERMHEVREILINQAGDQLSLRALALLVGTNEFNLKRDFKALFGNTVFAYLIQHKMEKAKLMLIDEDITVSEIAKRMGYKHATHFTSAFKKYFGFLPNKIKTGKLSILIFFDDFIALLENLNFMVI